MREQGEQLREEVARGSCLCGAVAFELTLPLLWFGYCHCSRCRKMTGSAASAVAGVLPDKFRWTKGAEELACFDLPGTKVFASCFCRHCGSTMPHPTRSGDDMYIIPMGALDDAISARPAANFHWQSRAAWYVHAGELPVRD